MKYFGLEIDFNRLETVWSYYQFSETQNAIVQFAVSSSGELAARHCGIGKGCFYTPFTVLIDGRE
jgi:hypothetical protein